MSNKLELLQDAALEIKSLRKQNELMAARLDVFDKMILLLHTPPNYQSHGMSEDLVWKIEKHIQETDVPAPAVTDQASNLNY